MMKIFDNGPWNLQGGADYLVSDFDYLNSSDREEAARVRNVVEAMFARFPTQSQEGLRSRLRSINNIRHLSAFFELALHELLIRSGCTVLAVEPQIEGTARSPDFYVESLAGDRFFLEATLATGRSQADQGADRRRNEALQAIESVYSPDFFLALSVSGEPQEPLSGQVLRRRLEAWLQALDYDDVVATWNDTNQKPPSLEYEQHGLKLVFSPVPRQRSSGTHIRNRAIGIQSLPPLSLQPQVPIRNAVLKKAGRYGDLEQPYIVAVNATSPYANADSAISALFGSPAVFVRQTEAGFEDRTGRVRDGVWVGQSGPTNTRVSGVFSSERLNAWSLGQRRARLIINPWAQNALAEATLPFTTDVIRLKGERLDAETGESIREVLGLPEAWPEHIEDSNDE